jgi:hypothetical protein
MVGSFDNYWWEDDNVTSLCLGNCTWATTLWDLNVSGACDGEYISAYGKLIPADSISGRMLDSIKIACLGSNTDDAWCLTESQNWVGSYVIQPDCAVTPSDPSCLGDGTAVDPSNERMANLYTDDVVSDFSPLLFWSLFDSRAIN